MDLHSLSNFFRPDGKWHLIFRTWIVLGISLRCELQSQIFHSYAFIMQLKQLKLAGFKSFVDPTVIPFPSQLVAVVGPNGCGKSNIIDAVRWVMGESSAKTLRGESMADVIFNGSSGRKSVGQASVELIFDNSLLTYKLSSMYF